VVIGLLVVGWLVIVRLADRGLRLQQNLDKIERDLDIAHEIQSGLLPRDTPDTPGFEVEGWSKPADQTGGDYFDWMKLPDGGTLITLADVSGHGIGPALIVAVCRAYMRAATADKGVALGMAISRVNDLLQVDIPDERFVTAAVGVLRPDSNELELVSAGQAPLFFYRAASQTVENWAADELPLGVVSGLTFEGVRKVRFEPGDTLVLTTDGFFEWSNDGGEQFGIKRLEKFVASHAHETPATFIKSLHAEVVAHAAGTAQPDDLTVVIVKRTALVQGRSASESLTSASWASTHPHRMKAQSAMMRRLVSDRDSSFADDLGRVDKAVKVPWHRWMTGAGRE
jgi:serine phosphatase RsbU (regulator of sigma subunit)